MSILETLAKDTDSNVRSSVAKHTCTPVVILEALANDNDSAVRRSVAKNPSAPSAVLQSLAQDKDFWIRDDVAENPYTSGAGLAILATDALEMVRKSVAANATAQVAVLESLSKDDDSYVRSTVASNLSTPEALLTTLAQDVHSEVRRNVALNPKTPVAVLRALAKDKDSGVRNAISENGHTPSDVLEKLATDKNAGVLIGVAENHNTPALAHLRLCDSKFESVREALAGQAHNSAELCQVLLKDSSEVVRLAVLRNKELDQVTLDELTVGIEREKDALALLEHPNLGTRSAQIIADKLFATAPTDSLWYRNQLSNASAEVQAAIKAHKVLSYPGKDPNKVLLEKRPLAPVMALCAGPFVDSNRIVKIASSTDWLVRAAVARNAGTPPNLLKKLSNDPHTLVSALAASRNADKEQATSNIGVSDANVSAFNLSRVVEEILRRMRADGQAWACVPLVNSKNWRNHANINEFLSWLKRHEFFDEVIDLFIRDLDHSNRDFFWQLVTQLKDGEVRMRLVKNVEVPVDTIEKLLLCEFVDVLLVIANRADVSSDLRSKAEKSAIRLITKKGSSYRQTIAKNHAYLTDAIRERLAKDKDFWVKREIESAQNSPYPEWIYQTEVLGCDDEDPELEVGEIGHQLAVRFGVERDIRKQQVAYWLDQLRAVFDREIRIHKAEDVLATNQLTPSDVSNAMIWLGYVPASDKVTPTKSARSTDWLTRLGAALHLGASQAILKLLKDDVDPDVAQAVKWREISVGEFAALHVKPNTK
jgi:3-methyladenine DNA glycosylase AlkC